MLFNSLEFLIFAAVFFCLSPLFGRSNYARWTFLITMSAVYYGWWDWRFLGLILVGGLIDFYVAWGIEESPRLKRWFLAISLLVNLGTLGVFKYLGFLTISINSVLGATSTGYALDVVSLLLPVGISFYTFQSLSYTIDVYRGQLKATRSLPHFFAFRSLFPLLLAGPIVRGGVLLPQLERFRPVTESDRWRGLNRIVAGFFKKVVIADNLSPVVNQAFSAASVDESGAYWWLIITIFAAQIYCDFSGYSDIAIGLAKWMGYDIPDNFRHPYTANSLRDFWQRWHISLSTWFRDYAYIPLGGSKGGTFAAHRNVMITMLLSGLWHGAAWTFVIWGFIHGGMMIVERITHWPERLTRIPGGRFVVTLIVLMQVWIAWVYFQAKSLDQANAIVSRMFDVSSFSLAPVVTLIDFQKQAMVCLALLAVRELTHYFGFDKRVADFLESNSTLAVLVLAVLIVACVFFRGAGGAFIYFQF